MIPKAYSELYQRSKMKSFVKIVNVKKLLTIFSKPSILDVSLGSEYASGYWNLFFSPIFNISKPCTLVEKKVCGDHTPNFFFAKPEYDKAVLFISGVDFVWDLWYVFHYRCYISCPLFFGRGPHSKHISGEQWFLKKYYLDYNWVKTLSVK